MRAELLAVGSELLGALRSDTNTLWLTEKLLEVGVEVAARITVADDAALLESAFRNALGRADLVIATGGLGPTEDDLTREAAAAALGRGIHRDPAILEALKARFARFVRLMARINEKQADVIDGAVALPNARGTAPGQRVEEDGKLLFLLPGPPGEMQPMFDGAGAAARARAGGRAVLRTRVLRIAAMAESDVDQVVAPVYKTFTNPRTTILGAAGQVELHLTAGGRSEAEAEERIEALAAGIRLALPGRIFSEDGRELPEVVAHLLRERGRTLAAAESCTGGLLAARLTDVPGASAFLERAFVTYSNRAKVEELGVDAALIEGARRGVGGGGRRHGRGGAASGRHRHRRRDHGDRRAGRRHAREAGRPRLRRPGRRGRDARPTRALPGRPRARALPGHAGRRWRCSGGDCSASCRCEPESARPKPRRAARR